MTERILITLPHLKYGGTERTAVELANFFASNKISVDLLLMFREERYYTLHQNVRIIEPEFTKKELGRYLYVARLLYFIRVQIRKQKPDAVFAIGYIAYALFASLGLKTKVIVSFRSSPTRIRFPRNAILNTIYKIAYKLLRNRIDGLIAQTYHAEEIYKKKYSCPIVTIPNFLRNLNDYTQERKDQIITVGHYSVEKGQHFLLKAFSKLNANNWKLVLVGDGPKRKELETLANELNIIDRVVFTGYKEDVDFYLSESKIFALTSIIEGYPNALIEAMANQLPPVCFNCDSGPSDIIVEGVNGYLVSVGDIETMKNRLQQLIDDPSLRERIGEKAYEIRNQNNLDYIANQYLEFFRAVIWK